MWLSAIVYVVWPVACQVMQVPYKCLAFYRITIVSCQSLQIAFNIIIAVCCANRGEDAEQMVFYILVNPLAELIWFENYV